MKNEIDTLLLQEKLNVILSHIGCMEMSLTALLNTSDASCKHCMLDKIHKEVYKITALPKEKI